MKGVYWLVLVGCVRILSCGEHDKILGKHPSGGTFSFRK